jgi:2-keto-4-pentenoate hydratase/2-oxohepta-3-ene-1,7-dioic acid hydratase in catechol pathway
MRLCRFQSAAGPAVGFYDERGVVPLIAAAQRYDAEAGEVRGDLPVSADLLDFLPPAGAGFGAARALADWVAANLDRLPPGLRLDPANVRLLVPVPRPNKVLLLAGNYAEHVAERGGVAAERAETFPYVFLKPPSTTLADPGKPVKLPRAAPDAVDWELELAVVVGRRCKHVREADALSHVAGYTVLNDVSQRRYKPNPGRKPRERDKFFDWLHGKWFDTFCPVGPCVASADAIPDPQALKMTLAVNGEVKQDGSTAQQIFPVAAVIEFISQMCTLEPGDLISTGTPAGVGAATGTFLKPGDVMRGWIERIGTLVTPVEAE